MEQVYLPGLIGENKMILLTDISPPWKDIGKTPITYGDIEDIMTFPPPIDNFHRCTELLRILFVLRHAIYMQRKSSFARDIALANADRLYWYLVSLYPGVENCIDINPFLLCQDPILNEIHNICPSDLQGIQDSCHRYVGYRKEIFISGRVRAKWLSKCLTKCDKILEKIKGKNTPYYCVVRGVIIDVIKSVVDEVKFFGR